MAHNLLQDIQRLQVVEENEALAEMVSKIFFYKCLWIFQKLYAVVRQTPVQPLERFDGRIESRVASDPFLFSLYSLWEYNWNNHLIIPTYEPQHGISSRLYWNSHLDNLETDVIWPVNFLQRPKKDNLAN